MQTLTFEEFAARYCERQVSSPYELRKTLLAQKARFHPKGWFMLECQLLDSSAMGSLTIVPYGGPENTYNQPPTHPVSPRGLASDMSTVVDLLPAEEVKEFTEEELEWNEFIYGKEVYRTRAVNLPFVENARRARVSKGKARNWMADHGAEFVRETP